MTSRPDLDPDRLLACPICDALHQRTPVPDGARARCGRCGTVLFAPRTGAVELIVGLALAAMWLLVVAVSFPFLQIETRGLESRASVMDAIMAFAEASGRMAPLSLVVAALIVALPMTRLAALLYALGPLARNLPPRPGAHAAFRLATRLRPWAMGEIFILGAGVALIKVASLAQVSLGPAFWAFSLLAVVVAVKDTLLCERSIWHALGPR